MKQYLIDKAYVDVDAGTQSNRHTFWNTSFAVVNGVVKGGVSPGGLTVSQYLEQYPMTRPELITPAEWQQLANTITSARYAAHYQAWLEGTQHAIRNR